MFRLTFDEHFTCRALLRHGITLWIDIPLQIIAEEFAEDRGQLPVFDISTSGSYSEVLRVCLDLKVFTK